MKILFVEASYKSTEPMSIMLLSALAQQRGHETFLYVLQDGDLKTALQKIEPDIAAYSAMSGEHRYFLKANDMIKNYSKRIFTIMGGRHPTFFPEVLKQSDLDAICLGEGDDAWPELLATLEEGHKIENIPNIITLNNFDSYALRPRRASLDDLPVLDYDLCYKNTPLGKSLKRTMITSRGCPYRCSYCFNHVYNKIYSGKRPVVARQSVSRVIGEAKYIIERWPTKFIKFYDDNFVLKLDDWLYEFSERWPKEIGLPFHCLLRANIAAKESKILALLKKAGLQSVSMSVESGNDYIRNQIFKRNMSKQEMEKAFKIAWNLGIHTFSNTILAVPISKEEEKFHLKNSAKRDAESVDFNLKIRATMTEYPLLFPYPGTEAGEYCKRNGLFADDYDNLTISYQNRSPMCCYTEKEKMVQQNLALLGTVLQAFAGSRNAVVRSFVPVLRFLVMNFLIKLPLGKVYLLPYVMVLNYLHRMKLYRYQKFGFREWLGTIPDSYRFNLGKQFEKTIKL